jgi:hypothetical protein
LKSTTDDDAEFDLDFDIFRISELVCLLLLLVAQEILRRNYNWNNLRYQDFISIIRMVLD